MIEEQEAKPRHRLFHWRRDTSPIGFLGAALTIAVVSTILTLIIPGLVAAYGNVFYKAGVHDRLRGTPKARLTAFQTAQQQHQATLRRLDEIIIEKLAQPGTDPNVELLFRVRDQVNKTLATATAPIAAIPFYLNPQMLLWPAVYTCLLWIAILMTPAHDLRFLSILLSRKTVELAVVTYLFYEWPLWLRNFVLSDEGRVVYAYPNVDIHVGSFIAQEVVIFGFCLLLAVIWRQWTAYLLRVRHDDPAGLSGEEHLALLTDPTAAASFAEVFQRWTICSFLLALGFVGLTAFYWNLVGKYHDQRYLLSAILGHVLWGFTWLTLSRPLFNEWSLWDRCRTYAFQRLAQMTDSAEATRRATLVKEIQPVTGATLTIANGTSVVSFIIPIVQAFID